MSLLTGDVTAEPLAEQDGGLPVRPAHPDPARLARWSADPAPWQARMAAAAAYLGLPGLAGAWPEQAVGSAAVAEQAANPATALARVLVDELRRCGLREAVVAPGSRSTPLALALFDASRARRAAAARSGRRAVGGVPGPGPGQGQRPARRGAVHLGHGRGALPRRGHRGRRGRRPAAGADRRPAARAARHRRQPGHRPAQAVRGRGALVLRGRRARGPAGHGRVLALAGRPGLGAWPAARRAACPARCT